MAYYTLTGKVNTYIGASTDTKPSTGVPAGSLAFETDTGILYILHGSTWYVYEGILKFTPSTAQVIDAAGDAILANATMVVLNPDADHTLTSTPTIADGVTGQILILTCANNEAHTVTIQDQDTLGSSNLQLLAATRAITGKTNCTLYFDGTDWVEFGGGGAGNTTIELPVGDATVYADGAANAGVVTENHDNTNHRNFLRWTSSTATQDIDFVWEFKLPSDFASFGTDALSIGVRTNDRAANLMTIFMYQADGTVDSGINGANIIPTGADDTWETKTDTPAGTYAASDAVHIHAHLTIDAASDTCDISRLFLTYTT